MNETRLVNDAVGIVVIEPGLISKYETCACIYSTQYEPGPATSRSSEPQPERSSLRAHSGSEQSDPEVVDMYSSAPALYVKCPPNL